MEGAVEDRPMVMLSGSAADETAVIGLDVAVQDQANGLWFDPNRSAWTADRKVLTVPQRGTTANPQWGAVFYGVSRGGTYAFEVTAFDEAGNRSEVVRRTVSVAAQGETDTADPTIGITAPADGATIQGTSVVFAGAAADDRRISRVDLAVQRASDGLWWQPSGNWSSGQTWFAANLASPGAAETDWRSPWVAPGGGDYTVTARAVDAAGKFASTSHAFGVEELAPDTVAPTVAVGQPTNGGQVQLDPLVIQGTADDDRDVAAVDVAIRDGASGQWWDGTRWVATFRALPAVLDQAGAPTTGWTYAWTPPQIGSYAIWARAKDAAGNVTVEKPWVPFTVIDNAADAVLPEVLVDAPTPGGSVAGPTLDIIGTASDNASVAGVDVAIRDAATGQWLLPNGEWGGFRWLPAALTGSGLSVDYSYRTDLPPGIYGALVRAVDGAGNASERVWVGFTVE